MDTQYPSEIADNEDGGVSISDSDSVPPQDERWASIVEPVTLDTLLDTLLAQLETLTTLCGLITVDSGKGLAWIEEYSTTLLNQKMPAYLQGSDRETETALIRANFICALADANFRSQRMDIGTYERAIEEAFSNIDLSKDPLGLSQKAEALITYNIALRFNPKLSTSVEVSASRWKVLTAALEGLTAASKLPSADNLAKIHLSRGDVEVLRFQLGQPPSQYDIAAKNGAVLVKNAEKFYRGAGNIARSSGDAKEMAEAIVKEALAAGMSGNTQRIAEVLKEEREAKEVVEDAIDDGLVTVDELMRMGVS